MFPIQMKRRNTEVIAFSKTSRRAFLLECAAWSAASALVGCGGSNGNTGVGSGVPDTTAIYALQAGQFASHQAADQLAASIRAQGVTSTVVPVVDEYGTEWAVVAIGRFSSIEEARVQRSYLANRLGLDSNMVPVLLPPSLPDNSDLDFFAKQVSEHIKGD